MEYVFGGFLNSIGEKLNNAATGNLKQKNYEKAITWYSRALLFTSLNRFPTFLSNRSLCHFKLKDYKSALVDSRKALEYDKKCEMAYEGIIKPCIHLGDFDGAENAIESLKTINPNNEYLKKAIWDCNYVTTLEKEAATCSKFKNFERAIEKISIALTYASNSDHLLSLKNQYTLEKENQNESSRVLYKDACKNYNLGHFEESLSIISQIIMNDPNYEKAIELMAKTKQFKEQKDLGNSFFGKQNYLKAYQLYREALKIDPSNIKMQSILHHNLAATNFNLLDYKQGIRDATAAIQHNPKYTKAYVIRAKCYFHLENYKESTQDCKFILLIETNNEIENLLKKCHLEESNIILIKEVTLRANLNFIRNNFKDCIIDCKKILEIKEIEDIRKLLERAECEESNRILIIKLLNQAEHYYQIPNYDLCVEECDKILKIQYCCKAKVLKDKAMSQIEQRRSLKCFLLTANSLFQQNDYKNCKHYCNLILSNTFEAGPRDPNKIEVNYLLEKIRKHVDEIIDQAKRNFILKNFNQCILDCVNILNIEESNEVNNLLKAARSEEDIINRIESIRTLFKTDCFKNCLNECYQILNMREMPEARQYLKNIRELIDKSMAQARIHLYLGYFDKCIKDCENVLNIEESNEAKQLIIRARSEKDINDRLSRIRTYYNKECFKDCITECNQILKIEEIPEARQILRKIRELINKSMAQAKRNFNLDNFDQCIMDCQFILNIEDSYEAFDLLDSARTEQVSKTIINEGLNRARRLYDTKYFRECIDECKNLLKIKEISEASNLIKMCESDIETAQSQTIEKLRKIAITFYDNKDYKKCKSHCYKILRIKELKAVRELLRKANLGIKNQKYINDIMIRARQHFQNKKYKECIAECENILRIEDIEEAKTLMNDAKFEMDRKYINDIMSRARLQFKNENYKECINECLKALEIGDLMEAKTLMKNAKAKMHEKVINEIMERARTNFKQTHYKECIEDCQKALEVDHGLMEAKSLMEKAKLELVNASKNFVKNKIVQAKIQFDKAEYEKCFVSCSSILEKEDVADVKDMLKKSKIALAYEKLTDPYEILEVSRSSDQLTIKSSYYLLSVRYHPDKHSKSTKEMRVYSENLYKKITNAYRSLSR